MSSLEERLDIGALVEMGFPKELVEQAVSATKHQGIPAALEWLFSHSDVKAEDSNRLGGDVNVPALSNALANTPSDHGTCGTGESPMSTTAPTEISNNSGAESRDGTTGACGEVAMSLICEDCGKQLRSDIDAQVHASKTGHQNFAESSAEIKPLTAEEREAQKLRLQQKLEERRQLRLQEEKQAELQREKSRRKTGKEITQARQDHDYQELKRLADERRKDKLEEKRLKQKIKDEIAKDRASFKSSLDKPEPMSKPSVGHPMGGIPAASVVVDGSANKDKDYSNCRIQFRLGDGSSVTATFKADDSLRDVYKYVANHHGDPAAQFTLSSTFPRKTYGEPEMAKSLKDLGLAPSSVLVVARR